MNTIYLILKTDYKINIFISKCYLVLQIVNLKIISKLPKCHSLIKLKCQTLTYQNIIVGNARPIGGGLETNNCYTR